MRNLFTSRMKANVIGIHTTYNDAVNTRLLCISDACQVDLAFVLTTKQASI